MWQRYFSQVLQDSFEAAKKKDPKLSLRGFAKRLDVSASVLSEIFRDQRKISGKRAMEIALAAGLDEMVLRQLEKNIRSAAPPKSRELLSSEVEDLVMNPLYYQLLCALEILPIPTTLVAVSRFLEVETKKLRAVAGQLSAMEIITISGDQIFWQGRHVTTSEDIPSKKIQAFHRQSLRDAARDLSISPIYREYTSVTFAGCVERLDEAKNSVRVFRDTLADSMRNSKPNRIYQLTIQLRPVSKIFREKE